MPQITIRGGRGVNKDMLPSELDAGVWSDMRNMRSRNGFDQRRAGISSQFTTPEVSPNEVFSYGIPSTRYIIRAGVAKVYADDGTASTNITPASDFTGTYLNRWDIESFNGVLVMNNTVNDPMYWNGNVLNNLTILPGWTTGDTARFVKAFKDFLIVGGPKLSGTDYPHNIMWSNSAEPGSLPTTFTAAADNDAGDTPQASETEGEIVDGLALDDVFVVYKEDARYGVQHIGGNDVFRVYRMDQGGDGLFAKGCVTKTPMGHVYMSPGDIRIHSGGPSRSIADGRIRAWIFDNIDSANAKRAFLVTNLELSEVWVCFPSSGHTTCDLAAVWNWKDDTWYPFTLPNATCGTEGLLPAIDTGTIIQAATAIINTYTDVIRADDFSETRRRMVLCNATHVGITESGSDDFGASISWYLERIGFDAGDSDNVKYISRSRPQPNATAGDTFSVKHGAAMTSDAQPTYSTAVTFTQGTTNWVNKIGKSGRYLALRLEGTSDISLRSVNLDIIRAGPF
jgi:hypothetical protein